MAVLNLISEQDFRTSRYAQVADQIEGRITDVIAQAEAVIERSADRTFSVQSYTELLRPQSESLFLRNRPIQTLTSVRRRSSFYADWEELNTDDFEVQARQGYVRWSGGTTKGYEVEVEYDAGFAEIPQDIKAAVILQTVILAYQDLEVYGSGDGKQPGILYLQEQVATLLKPYSRKTVL